jgi:diguanylate cyclase (GGDEF)-like protein
MPLDNLTGLPSRVDLLPRLNDEIYCFNLDQKPFCMAWVNIDRFKTVNDTYGHLVGDNILKDLAQIIKQATEPSGFACRYGGDNFAMIFSGCSVVEGIEKAELIRKTVDDHKFDQDVHITVSIGVEEYNGGTWEEFFNKVDQYAYMAKHDGRNRVCHREF